MNRDPFLVPPLVPWVLNFWSLLITISVLHVISSFTAQKSELVTNRAQIKSLVGRVKEILWGDKKISFLFCVLSNPGIIGIIVAYAATFSKQYIQLECAKQQGRTLLNGSEMVMLRIRKRPFDSSPHTSVHLSTDNCCSKYYKVRLAWSLCLQCSVNKRLQ